MAPGALSRCDDTTFGADSGMSSLSLSASRDDTHDGA
jgi:hypothetical protein